MSHDPFARLCLNCNEGPLEEIPAYDHYRAVFRCKNNCGATDVRLTQEQFEMECRETVIEDVERTVAAMERPLSEDLKKQIVIGLKG
jgi:hypothetical protein